MARRYWQCFAGLGGLLLIANPSPARSQSAPPASAGLIRGIDSLFSFASKTAPGCALGVARAGRPIFQRAYGMADLNHDIANTPSTVFETGSLAKQFTAAAVLLLVHDGKLALDDDIRRYIPEVPDFGTPIMIRHLLTHTSGLREQWSLLALAGNPPGTQVHTLATIVDLVSRQRGLNFSPGEEFYYTNTGYALLAVVVERVSGRSMEQFTHERLFQPLRMTNTHWREDFRTIVPLRATAYSPASPHGFRENMPFTNVYGNGGLYTTIGDLLRWNAFLDDPSAIAGGRALVDTLQAPGHLRNGAPLTYAFGLEVATNNGMRSVSHDGSTAGYKTWLGRYPDQGISVAMLCNHGGIDPVQLGLQVAARVLQWAGHPVPVVAAVSQRVASPGSDGPNVERNRGQWWNPVTGELAQTLNGRDSARFVAVRPPNTGAAALAEYIGTYYCAELEVRVAVARQGDALVVRQRFGTDWQLQATFADGFTTPLRGTTAFVFSRSSTGQVDGFGAWAGGARNIRFVRE